MTSCRALRVAWSTALTAANITAMAGAQPAAVCEPAEEQLVAPDAARESGGTLAKRVVAEALIGTGLATIGFLAGPELTAAGCRNCSLASGLAGANVMFPLGVYWGGNVVGGDGSFWLTAAAPWAVSAAGFTALALDRDYNGSPALEIGAIGGAIAAPLSIVLYELSNASRAPGVVQKPASLRPRVVVSPRDDVFVLRLTGEF